VLILSRHYDVEGLITVAGKSTRKIKRASSGWKRFYLEISSFFLTMETTTTNVQKMSLYSKTYNNILVAPWIS
jgi:hypothetical protein